MSYQPFFATCITKHDNMSTIFITKFSSLKRSTLGFFMLKPQKTLHSLNAFFPHDSTCLLACFTTSFIHMFNVLHIKIKDVGFWNGILDIKHTKMIFNNLSRNFKCKSFKVQMNNGTQNVEETT